jgi:hypothetical protein
MKYADDIGSGAMIHIPGLITFGSDIKKVDGGYRGTHTARRARNHAFFKTGKVG